MKPKVNSLVKIIVPVAVLTTALIGVKSCSGGKTQQTTSASPAASPLKDLSPEDLKTLGVEGDTPHDTLNTIVGRFRSVQSQLDGLSSENKNLRDENKKLTQTSHNVQGQISQAVSDARAEDDKKQEQLRKQVSDLAGQVGNLASLLKNGNGNGNSPSGSGAGMTGQGSDIPVGLGFDGNGSTGAPASDGFVWVEPRDGLATDASGRPVGNGNNNNATGFSFATSFGDAASATGKKVADQAGLVSMAAQNQGPVDPVYTIPENATLIGSRAMTALLGRIPIDGKVTDPYPFKVLIGKDNLTANGIDLPDVQGAVVSGSATGDWTLSCVRGTVTSITFVFTDGTIRTVPSPDGQGQNNQSGQNNQNGGSGTNGGIGWLSDENGIPCLSGDRKSNASTYLPTLFGLAAGSAAGDALAANQQTAQTNALGGVTSTLTGDAGQAVLGKALSGGMAETVNWVKARYGQTFDAIYVPPGQKVAVHITRQLAIDYAEQGRKVKYDFSLSGSGTGMD